MGDNGTDVVTGPAVVAMAQEGNRLRGIMLQKRGEAFEILWTKSSKAGQADLGAFAVECDLPAGPAVQAQKGSDRIAVVGFDSAGVVFYRIRVPAVKEEEVAAMVKLQAEARLPLPAEQMELVWRADKAQDGQVAVTMAAAKTEQLQQFVGNVRGFEPAKILLDCEGIVKAWRELFSGNDELAVVVSIGSRNTQVCLAEDGKLINAVSLDIGIEDFSAVGGLAEQTEAAERLAQDMRSVLELFGYAEPTAVPVFVLSDGRSRSLSVEGSVQEPGVMESVVSCLGSAGLNVKAALPEVQKLRAQTRLSAGEVYEYHVPIGLALVALDGDVAELNVFERLYRPAGEEVRKRWFYSPKVTGAIAAVMVALLAVVLYAVTMASDKRLSKLSTEADFKQLMQRQKLIKAAARQRPDLLQLLSAISSSEGEGIMLDSLHFRTGEPVSIRGEAPNAEQLYKFQESLLTRNGIKDVKIQNTSQDKEKKKIKFTMTFHYKGFTKKKSRSQI